MKTLYINNVNFGVYNTIEVAGDRLITDNSEYPISVIGSDYQIVEGAEYPPVVEVVNVPQVISMAQCREKLIRLGLDDEIEAILASIPDPVKQKIYKSAWEYNTTVKIDNAMLLELAPLLSIDLDQFFIDASNL